jgi:hypothetical protein
MKQFARDANLTAVNSINFARIAAQTVYYFVGRGAARRARRSSSCRPEISATCSRARPRCAWDCRIRKLVIATNANDIMARALNDGVYESGAAHRTLSPSMDIQVASNFERALFEATGRDARWTRRRCPRSRRRAGSNCRTPVLQRSASARYCAFALRKRRRDAGARSRAYIGIKFMGLIDSAHGRGRWRRLGRSIEASARRAGRDPVDGASREVSRGRAASATGVLREIAGDSLAAFILTRPERYDTLAGGCRRACAPSSPKR